MARFSATIAAKFEDAMEALITGAVGAVDRFRILADGTMGWGPDGTYDVSLGRGAAGRLDILGGLRATEFQANNNQAALGGGNQGGHVELLVKNATPTVNASRVAVYLRDGTTANTVKLCIKAGNGAEQTVLDNIPKA